MEHEEWYYSSGSLQKSMVVSAGCVADPIRLYCESGQLAEEMFIVPWNAVIHNVWNSQDRQVVTNGTGIFDDDGCAHGSNLANPRSVASSTGNGTK